MLDSIYASLDSTRDEIIDLQRKMTAIPALGPKNGGTGEHEKAAYLKDYLKQIGFEDIRELQAPDKDAKDGYRPSLIGMIPGKDSSRTFWVISHMDIVPPGDRDLWDHDPYDMQVDGDIISGRGVEDNQQGIVSSLLLAKELLDRKITPEINYGVLLVADEETHSEFGLTYIVNEHEDLFTKDDLIIVPDYGNEDGTMVEVAEKCACWMKFTVHGKQCHASVPDEGNNTFVASSALVVALRQLYDIFDAQDPKYAPACSTFEPTQKEANVENVNTIPGRDVFFMDMRVLPVYGMQEVFKAIRELADQIEKEYDVRVDVEALTDEEAAPETPVDHPVVVRMSEAIRAIIGKEPKITGIGGNTVAAVLRRKEYPAVVWASLIGNAHQPNEVSSIAKTIQDAKVLAHALLA